MIIGAYIGIKININNKRPKGLYNKDLIQIIIV